MKDITCLSCGSPRCELIFSLGSMPPVNAFIKKGDLEELYPLDVYYCQDCSLIQLGEAVSPEKLFSNYLHTSSASAGNVRHLKEVAYLLVEKKAVTGRKILEIGSNDGLLLQLLQEQAGVVLGVDPAANLSSEVYSRGVRSLVGFFDESFAIKLKVDDPIPFDTIVALNVMAHTPTFISALRGIKHLLSPDGIFFMENAYVLDTVLRGQFDTIYHEHIFCFSMHSLINAYEMVGLTAVDAEIIPTQGQSIRVYVKHSSELNSQSDRLKDILRKEKIAGFNSIKSFNTAADLILLFRKKFTEYIERDPTVKFVALGAPARGIVILNYCQVGSEQIEFIIDDTELKQGKIAPGCAIPVFGWEALNPKIHHKFIVLSWNYAEDMISRLREKGVTGSVLLPFPEFKEITL